MHKADTPYTGQDCGERRVYFERSGWRTVRVISLGRTAEIEQTSDPDRLLAPEHSTRERKKYNRPISRRQQKILAFLLDGPKTNAALRSHLELAQSRDRSSLYSSVIFKGWVERIEKMDGPRALYALTEAGRQVLRGVEK